MILYKDLINISINKFLLAHKTGIKLQIIDIFCIIKYNYRYLKHFKLALLKQKKYEPVPSHAYR
jgi:hypothetical protein